MSLTFWLPPIATMPSPNPREVTSTITKKNSPGSRLPPIRLQACLFKYRTRVISYIINVPFPQSLEPRHHSSSFHSLGSTQTIISFSVAWRSATSACIIPYCTVQDSISFHGFVRTAARLLRSCESRAPVPRNLRHKQILLYPPSTPFSTSS